MRSPLAMHWTPFSHPELLQEVQQRLTDLSNLDFSNFNPRMIHDAGTKLESDVLSLQNNPMLKEGVQVFGAVYDVDTGEVNWIE